MDSSGIPSHPSFRPDKQRTFPAQTLPPLPQQIYNHPASAAHPPVTPSTPQNFHPGNGFSHFPSQQDRAMPPPSSFGQPVSLMTANHSMMSTAGPVSSPHILSSATQTSRLPDLLPAPQAGLSAQTALPPFNYGQQQQLLPQQSLQSPTDPPPTHVVGSQGRRGVLPSAPGRPVALPGTAVAGKSQPQKDAEGKFPCEHCNKTYLHLKHLKRHMLRRKFHILAN